MLKRTAIATLLLLPTASAAWGGSVQLLPGSRVSLSVNSTSDVDSVPSLPYTAAARVDDSTGSLSGTYRFSDTRFDIAINQLSLSPSFNSTAASELLFSPVGDVAYNLSLSLSESNGAAATGGVELIDLATGQAMFDSSHDGLSGLAGATAAGQLLAGRQYMLRFELEANILGLSTNSVGRGILPVATTRDVGTVSAFLQFDLESTAVPLPPAAWMGLALLGTVGGGGLVRKRRTTAIV